ncbi:hypothetical protein J2Z48_002992 [Croceifilum oryzae]|uniref:Uncharacterized protein n=1 Tax=Croceifilum oryzae TaxID=1553429 RepID=A0AAJ1TH55_9BACL|nr:hypothetical protein [Croceifilum oryzae]MDQ0418788.1 hypothetical protein [Croceifilum oryzae]
MPADKSQEFMHIQHDLQMLILACTCIGESHSFSVEYLFDCTQYDESFDELASRYIALGKELHQELTFSIPHPTQKHLSSVEIYHDEESDYWSYKLIASKATSFGEGG